MQYVKNLWNRSIIGKLVVGLGALVVGCCGLSAIGAAFAPRATSPVATAIVATVAPTQTSVPATVTPAPTATAVPPTATPEPTATEVPPTPTAELSATPEATATSEPTATEAVASDKLRYRLQIGLIATDLASAFRNITELLTKAGEDVTLILTDDWKIDMAAQMVRLNLNADKLRDLETPAGLDEVDEKVESLASELDLVVFNFTEGIDKMDLKKINAAAGAMERSGRLATEIAELLTE